MAAIPEVLFSREFVAPRELVFAAWTEPARLQHWWGPKGFGYARCTLDLRPGGIFHYCLRAPDGRELWGKFVYREVAPPERLSYVVSFSDENCGITRHPLAPQWPLEVLSTLTFTALGGATQLDGTAAPVNATDEELRAFEDGREGMQAGLKGTLDQLEAYLKTVTPNS